MKNVKLAIFLVFIINSLCLFSQQKIYEKLIDPFQKDALLREKVFLHLNKTVYFANENIWFTAYITEDANNFPSNYTSNLHVNLLNQNGDIIVSKNLFIKNGIGFGDFLISDKIISGNYYIQAFTQFMQNFGKENVFIQEIEIINPSIKKQIEQKATNKYDLQVFPESGYLLEDAENVLGIKALINSRGYPFKGTIINSKGLEITFFQGNVLGMAKCKFYYKKNETYTAIININKTTQKISLPIAEKTGIIFSLDNSDYEKIKLSLKTNKETLNTKKNESLALIFYRNNFISTAVELSLNNNKELKQDLFFDKDSMQNGVNIVTLFKNYKPIAERKFFIEKFKEQTAILISKQKTVNDSVYFEIRTINSNNEAVKSQLSISTLPLESKVFIEKQNIKTAFLLSPYIKGKIENPAFYFNSSNEYKDVFLDLLLLNQGWSAYSLEEKIKEINPRSHFIFESGFSINGRIERSPKGYDIGLLSKSNNLIAISKIEKNNEFSFENIFAYKNDFIKVTLVKKNQSLKDPYNVNFNENINKRYNYSYLTRGYGRNIFEDETIMPTENGSSNLNQYPNTEQLNEVFLQADIKKRIETNYDLELNFAKNHNEFAPEFFVSKKITEKMEINNRTIFDYFRGLGYIKLVDNYYFISLRNAPITLFGKHKNPDNTYPPKIFVDNVALENGDIEALQSIYMFDIDVISINKSGAGGGIDGAGGIIKIYLKKGDHKYFEGESKKLYKELILLTGFDKANTYYRPQFNSYTKESYDWTEIDWQPYIKTNINGEFILRIPVNEFSEHYQFVINGFSENGLLFHNIYKSDQNEF